jgi:predicted alpha/beta-hydrolase family hydrolase
MASRDSSEPRVLETPVGPARAAVSRAVDRWATLVLGHGAGGGIGAADLVALANRLPAHGIEVVRVEQPWVGAGRKVATPPPTLDRAWRAVLEHLSIEGLLLVGGRSAGARVACRTASEVGAHGVLCLAFPLHPPGRPEKSRLAELDLPAAAGLPTLVLQGTRDSFGGPADIPAAPGRLVVPIEGGDHSLRVAQAAGGSPLAHVVEVTLQWARQVTAG